MNMQRVDLRLTSRMRMDDSPRLYWKAHLDRIERNADDVIAMHDATVIDLHSLKVKMDVQIMNENGVDHPFAVTEAEIMIDFDRVHVDSVNEIAGTHGR